MLTLAGNSTCVTLRLRPFGGTGSATFRSSAIPPFRSNAVHAIEQLANDPEAQLPPLSVGCRMGEVYQLSSQVCGGEELRWLMWGLLINGETI